MVSDISKTIDYVKSQIKNHDKAKEPLPYQKFDQNKWYKHMKRIKHYTLILKILEERSVESERVYK